MACVQRGSPPLPFLVTCGAVRVCAWNVLVCLGRLVVLFLRLCLHLGFLLSARAGSVLLLCLVQFQRDIHKTSTCSQHSDEPHADFC